MHILHSFIEYSLVIKIQSPVVMAALIIQPLLAAFPSLSHFLFVFLPSQPSLLWLNCVPLKIHLLES